MKERIGPRITPESQEFYTTRFKTLNAGAEFAIEIFPRLYNMRIKELVGIFSKPQLDFLKELSSNKMNAESSGVVFFELVATNIALADHKTKKRINTQDFVHKLSLLETIDRIFLEVYIKSEIKPV